ncbi:hypothetical protein [Haloarcula nitratireducens]|uniref:DUF2238 domain-containing protein n=1 Tax=Haloarcula nitratireducens TaxID=2487749 RepID=A0AAW4PFW2_9EURY|nr:hypothetical protein [Halomicroarcula nitratireducens]MBX0296753.1 hypothetical protein [Halomicroarcula nitratireducens]
MTLTGVLDLSTCREQVLTRGLQVALLVLAAGGVATGRLGVAANAAPALGVTLLPAALRREYGYVMDARLALWITVAVCLHSLGALGPYRWYPWYDEITHTVSGALVAGIGYATLRAFEEHSPEVTVPDSFRGFFVVIFVLAFGVIWEVFEFTAVVLAQALGTDAPVTVFGINDIVTDMVANMTGGILIALWGTRYFQGLAGFFRTRLDASRDRDPR